MAKAAELIGDRWTLLIIRELLYGPIRFGEIERNLPGISKSVLSQRLKRLKHDGIARTDTNGAYEFTKIGETLRPVVQTMGEWVATYVLEEPTRAEADPELLMLFVSRHVDVMTTSTERFHWTGIDETSRWATATAEAAALLAATAESHDRNGTFVKEGFDVLRTGGFLSMLVPCDLGGGGPATPRRAPCSPAWPTGVRAPHWRFRCTLTWSPPRSGVIIVDYRRRC